MTSSSGVSQEPPSPIDIPGYAPTLCVPHAQLDFAITLAMTACRG